MTTLSQDLVNFVTGLHYDDLPDEVRERARLATLDIIGVCLLGSRMEFGEILLSAAGASGGAPECTLIGRGGLKLPAPLATLFHGGLAHGNEFDDTYAPGRWHAGAAALPAALATAESAHVSGKDYITAAVAGLEVGCRLTRAAPGMLQKGFQSTSCTGIFAAVVAVAKLMNLDPERFAWAIGICGGFCSGTMEFLGDPEPWSKRIQVGYAGQGAILAARAASRGFKGPLTILEGRHGYFNSHAGAGNFDLTSVCDALGSDWQLMRIYAKRYPCDHLAQGYVDCAIALGSLDGVVPQRIRQIECIVHPLVVSIAFEPREMRYAPGNSWSARWSLPFAVAVAMTDRALTIDSYTDERARDDYTRALMAKVTHTLDPSLAFPNDYPAWVRVHMSDGQVLEHRLPKVIGTPENPMDVDEYEAKFSDNARRSIEPARASRLASRLRQVSAISDMSELAALYG